MGTKTEHKMADTSTSATSSAVTFDDELNNNQQTNNESSPAARSDLEKYLYSLIDRVSGLRAVFVCDRDGVTLLKAIAPNNEKLASDDEVTLAASFAVSADQVAKVHLGKVNSLAAFFNNQLIVHINVLPLVVALIADPDSNAALMMALQADLSKALQTLRDSVQNLDSN